MGGDLGAVEYVGQGVCDVLREDEGGVADGVEDEVLKEGVEVGQHPAQAVVLVRVHLNESGQNDRSR